MGNHCFVRHVEVFTKSNTFQFRIGSSQNTTINLKIFWILLDITEQSILTIFRILGVRFNFFLDCTKIGTILRVVGVI